MTAMTGLTGVLAALSLTVYAETAVAESSAFHHALSENYAALSQAELAQGDRRDALTYSRRAAAAAQGQPTAPEPVELRRPFLKEKYVEELSQARTRLVAALEGSGSMNMPADAARAQASYDCWLEQSSEDLQPEDISACRNSFVAAITRVEDGSVAERSVPPVPATADEAVYPEKFLVFFDFDRAELTSEGLSVIDSASTAASRQSPERVVATGHADRSGSDSYNMRLSSRRADAVKAALATAGVPAESISTAALGETEPLVETKDGVREAQNRRVEILLER